MQKHRRKRGDGFRGNGIRECMEQARKEKEKTRVAYKKSATEFPGVERVPQEDVLTVDKRWGYFSEKDNRIDHFDLCESCYDELTRRLNWKK